MNYYAWLFFQRLICLSHPGLPRSWKSHDGISGNSKISRISGKVMEFRLKLTKVTETSWNFEIRTKSHGKVMELTNRSNIL